MPLVIIWRLSANSLPVITGWFGALSFCQMAIKVTQIESYAFSVMNDPRFKQVGTTWVFWVISDELAPYT